MFQPTSYSSSLKGGREELEVLTMGEQSLVPFHHIMSWNPDDSSFIHFITFLFMGRGTHTVVCVCVGQRRTNKE